MNNSTYVPSHYLQLTPDLVFHYRDSGGSGIPLLFLPGWNASTAYLTDQLAYFSQHYRVIAIDPRSQGLTTKTLNGHYYQYHADDLANFLIALRIEKANIICHSYAAYTIYSHVRRQGILRFNSILFADAVLPRNYWDKEGEDWAKYRYWHEIIDIWNVQLHHRKDFLKNYIKEAYEREVPQKEFDTMMDMFYQAYGAASRLLWTDMILADYVAEARYLDISIPTAYVVSNNEAPYVVPFVKQHLPNAQVAVIGHHYMHREMPDEYNEFVHRFIESV